MTELYPYLKALHLFAVIAWMAGLLYLPRLFVYHAEAAIGSDKSETFKVMERRLLRGIMNPAMVVVWALGLYLAWAGDWWAAPWLHAKLALVVLLTLMHHLYSRWRKAFERDANRRPARFYRLWNEAPTLPLLAILVLVIVKPF
jgi:protoporphyrinogen IX oxidase